MVMNEKILQRKFEKINKIINEDGGCSLIEVMGLLRYCEIRYIEESYNKAIENIKPPASYESLKKKRVGAMNA